MKKLIITTIAVSAVTATTFAQGFVNFATSSVVANRISTNSVVGGAATGATAPTAGLYYYALFASSSQTTVNGTTTAFSGINSSYVFLNQGGGTVTTGLGLVGLGENSASLGRQAAISQGTTSANQGALNADSSLTVQGIAGGGSANFVAIGWSANIGTTLASLVSWYNNGSPASAGWIGQSAVSVGAVLGDGGLNSTPNAMGTGSGAFPGFTLGLTAVPEPATLALAALGGASLLMLRRKK